MQVSQVGGLSDWRRMKPTPAKLAMAVAGILLVLAAFRFSQRRDHDQPVYDGRTLSQWLADFDVLTSHPDRESPTYLQASNAVVQIGTNGLPFLLKWIQYEPSSSYRLFWDTAIKGLDKLPGEIVPVSFSNWMTRSGEVHRSYAAGDALLLLGPQLEPVIPQLASIAETGIPRNASRFATQALGSAASVAWGEIVRLVANTNYPGSITAIYEVLPMGTNAGPAIPPLIRNVQQNDRYLAVASMYVLAKLQIEPATVVPALTQALTSTVPGISEAAAKALAKFGSAGSPALPELRVMLSDSNSDRRSAASNSIQAITAAMAAATNTP